MDTNPYPFGYDNLHLAPPAILEYRGPQNQTWRGASGAPNCTPAPQVQIQFDPHECTFTKVHLGMKTCVAPIATCTGGASPVNGFPSAAVAP
jgi:hypothetical protein